MSEENKSEYPCTECAEAGNACERQRKYLRCYKWRRWFHEQWEHIQKIFARDVSDRHNEKEGDDK